jgi:hypothetical protein
MGKIPAMTITADAKKRVRLGLARPGDRFDVQVTEDGAFILRRLEPVTGRALKARLVKDKDDFTSVIPSQPINEAAIEELLADFPRITCWTSIF